MFGILNRNLAAIKIITGNIKKKLKLVVLKWKHYDYCCMRKTLRAKKYWQSQYGFSKNREKNHICSIKSKWLLMVRLGCVHVRPEWVEHFNISSKCTFWRLPKWSSHKNTRLNVRPSGWNISCYRSSETHNK